jgi:hypothetical protein
MTDECTIAIAGVDNNPERLSRAMDRCPSNYHDCADDLAAALYSRSCLHPRPPMQQTVKEQIGGAPIKVSLMSLPAW